VGVIRTTQPYANRGGIALPGVAVVVGRVATHLLVILFERIENDSMVDILAIVLTAAPPMKFEYDRCTTTTASPTFVLGA
jgi:hypothetical protein